MKILIPFLLALGAIAQDKPPSFSQDDQNALTRHALLVSEKRLNMIAAKEALAKANGELGEANQAALSTIKVLQSKYKVETTCSPRVSQEGAGSMWEWDCKKKSK